MNQKKVLEKINKFHYAYEKIYNVTSKTKESSLQIEQSNTN